MTKKKCLKISFMKNKICFWLIVITLMLNGFIFVKAFAQDRYQPYVIPDVGAYGCDDAASIKGFPPAFARICGPAYVEIHETGSKHVVSIKGQHTMIQGIQLLMIYGSVHQYFGDITMDMGNFISDSSYPLTFKIERGLGYVYLCGRGNVKTLDGEKVQLGQNDYVKQWIERYNDTRVYVRQGAVMSLKWLAKDTADINESRKVLIAALKDSSWEVRREAIKSFSRIGGEKALDYLTPLCDPQIEPNEIVREECKKAVSSIKSK